MDSEVDEESSNPILALSGSLMPETVHSSTSSLPANSRQPSWADVQAPDLDVSRLPSLASPFSRAEIAPTTGAAPTQLEAGGMSAQKREALPNQYYTEHQNLDYKESFNHSFPQSNVFNIRNDKHHVSKAYDWRLENPVTVNSTSGHSLDLQITRPNNKTINTHGFTDIPAKSFQDSGNSKQYLKKRPLNDFQASSSDLLYSSAHLSSSNHREQFYIGTENKSFNRSTQVHAHSSSSICPADSSGEPSDGLQQMFASTSSESTQHPGQVSLPDESNDVQRLLKDQAEHTYTRGLTNFRTSKRSYNSHEQQEILTFDHKQMDGHEPKNDFDFSFGVRSFPPLSFATDFSNRSRPNHHETNAAHSDLASQNFFTTSTSVTNRKGDDESNFGITLTPNSTSDKKKTQGCVDFGTDNLGQDLRIVEPSHRKTFENQTLSTTLETSLPGNYVDANDEIANFRHQAFNNANQMNFNSQINPTLLYKSLTPVPEENTSWMGRSRAHRKMARLLGTGTIDQAQKHSSSNDVKATYSLNDIQNPTEVHHRSTSGQDINNIGANFQAHHPHSLKDACNLSKDFLTLEDDLSFKTGENPMLINSSISSRISADTSERQVATNRELFTVVSSTSTPNFMYQGPGVHSLSQESASHRELDFPIFTAASTTPRDHAYSNLPMTSASKNILDTDFTSVPIHKDSVVPGFFMNNQQSQQPLGCLDFASSQRDLDLSDQFTMQDPKDFAMDAGQVTEQQMDLATFGQDVDTAQPDLTLTDSLALGSHGQQDLNLEAYFNPQPSRDQLNGGRKLHGQHGMRDVSCFTGTAESVFNLDEYMNSSTGRDASSSYFMQANLPQDMTICQKPVSQKTTFGHEPSQESKQNQRQTIGRAGSLRGESQEEEMSKQHRESTKSSTKESMKGIRNPRDIGRAVEIFQSLQADEKEEQHRKEQEWKRQQHQQLLQQQQQSSAEQIQLQQQQSLHLQQQQQQQQGQGPSFNSSPKKTFQNKHYFESLGLAMAEHQLLGTAENLIDDQTVGNFLDQSQLDISDQSSDNLQMMQTFHPFPGADSGIITTEQYAKKDLNQPLACELDYHILKRIALAPSIKDSKDQQVSFSSLPDQCGTTNLSSLLPEGNISAGEGSQNSNAHYPTSRKLPYSQRQEDFQDTFSGTLNSKDSFTNTTKSARSRLDSDFPFADLEVNHQLHQTKQDANRPALEHLGSVPSAVSGQENIPVPLPTSSLSVESLSTSRKNMYSMMKAEQFCDAILSTPKQTVKVFLNCSF
ncbi:hypothetical protein ElyMa_003970300 [Elysia marginata]|uniref:Uncharacterized protein n=1 Tax=Elysia marginata TaxID=1093978 RepID=A0AAV4FYT2_9GAST|nr:hypothetical protein ElyMa_003970300 [Elysia marginata]